MSPRLDSYQGRLGALLVAATLLSAIHSNPASASGGGIGEREFVDRFLPIPTSVTEAVGALLPEQSNVNASFLSGKYDPNLLLKEPATVAVTFVWEGAGYRNTLGYFTYTVTPEGYVKILDRQLIFPNASLPSAGKLETGDTVTLRDADGKIRTFSPDTRIGFFLVADGFSSTEISKRWNAASATIPTTSPETNLGTVKGVFTSLDVLNPEHALKAPDQARHVALMNINGIDGFLNGEDFLLLAFEDMVRPRGSDNDFNDCVFLITATPQRAIATDALPTVDAPSADNDGDGVVNANDQFPDDPTRALISSSPSRDYDIIGLEDQYPAIGDADYNDAVIADQFQVVTDAKGNVRDILGTFHLLARGAGYDHAFGIHLPGIPDDATGSVSVDRFLEDEGESREGENYDLKELLGARQRRVEVFPSTRAAMPAVGPLPYVNTRHPEPDRLAASARFLITFDTAVPAAALGSTPFDPYFTVRRKDGRYDIHLPGHAGFADRDAGLPVEKGSEAFLDDNGYPWMLSVPYGWRFPLEAVPIGEAYEQFPAWAAKQGAVNPTWYSSPTPDHISAERGEYVRLRDWKVQLPQP